jgi:hypothetical protein
MSEIPGITVFPTYAWSDRELLESDLRVLGVLCARRNRNTGQCNPSKTDIALHCGYSLRTVSDSLGRLYEHGYIDWEQTYHPSTGAQRTNRYRILPFDDGSWTPIPDPHATQAAYPPGDDAAWGDATATAWGDATHAADRPGDLGRIQTEKGNLEVELRSELRIEHGASSMRELGTRSKDLTEEQINHFDTRAKIWRAARETLSREDLELLGESRLLSEWVRSEETDSTFAENLEAAMAYA